MTAIQLFLSQLGDPFRIVLLVGLLLTMGRTRAQTGIVIPLIAGAVFVAALIPITLGAGSAEPFWRQFAAGLAANAVILAVLLGLWAVYRRLRGG